MTVDIGALSQQIQGDVITPDHADYPNIIARWAKNAERKARIVVCVRSPQDVAAALRFAKSNALPVAVRGGGHSASGASSVEDGLVIDLSRYLNKVTVDPEQRLGYVDGGATWATVDSEAIKHGLATVGGTVNHTGVGGLILGGGYGWLSPAHGLAIDNLTQATVVIADGSIVTASDIDNPDLFFAIRGGGGNFGVVTQFVLRLHPQRSTVYAGPLFFAPNVLKELVPLTKKWLEIAGEDEGMLQATAAGPDGKPVVVVFPFFNGPEEEGRGRFKEILALGPFLDRSAEIPYEQLNSLQNPMAMHGSGVYMKGIGQVSPNLENMEQAYNKFIDSIPRGFGGGILFEYFNLKKVTSVQRDTTAFKRVNAMNVLINLNWDPATGDQSIVAREIAYGITSIMNQGQGTSTESLGYGNYDDDPEGRQQRNPVDRAKLAFGENYSRLQNVKKKYDPENVFNKWFPITPN